MAALILKLFLVLFVRTLVESCAKAEAERSTKINTKFNFIIYKKLIVPIDVGLKSFLSKFLSSVQRTSLQNYKTIA